MRRVALFDLIETSCLNLHKNLSNSTQKERPWLVLLSKTLNVPTYRYDKVTIERESWYDRNWLYLPTCMVWPLPIGLLHLRFPRQRQSHRCRVPWAANAEQRRLQRDHRRRRRRECPLDLAQRRIRKSSRLKCANVSSWCYKPFWRKSRFPQN